MVLLGKADDRQVQVAAALPPASVTYLERPRQLPALGLERGAIDLVLVTQPGLLIVAALDGDRDGGGEPPMLVAAHAGPPWALELPPQVDLLRLPAPMPLARVRLALALRIARAAPLAARAAARRSAAACSSTR